MSTSYQHLRQELPKKIFKPKASRLLFITFVQLGAYSSIAGLILLDLPVFAKVLLGLFIGYCWALSGLLAHELLHGSIVRNKKLQNFLGFFLLLPFVISPTFWRYWHNNLHHSHTQKLIVDPDAYPNLRVFKQSKYMQWMYPFTPGSGHKRSYAYFFFWFFVNTLVAQIYFRHRNGTFKKLNHKKVNVEFFTMMAIHLAALFYVGPSLWLWAVIIPFLVMNYLPYSYISTNHNLSPLTKENDSFKNSLTVTNNKFLEWIHINFGYHVEHHLFPTVCGHYLKDIHEVLKVKYPDEYQYMPKWKAMKLLYKTARIYKNKNTLMNPETGETYPVIASEAVAPSQESAAKSPEDDIEKRPVPAASL